MKQNPSFFQVAPPVAHALKTGAPVVALESTVITHGLPRPQNLQLAQSMEAEVTSLNAVPATVALMGGKIRVGLAADDMHQLASAETVHKISTRDIAAGLVHGWNGGTTVAATMFCARQTGIKIFATGGIGGVHRGNGFDVSADLTALAEIPIVVVCSGAKAILDLPATCENLETCGVPVVGFQTGDFPAFYSSSSGLPVDFIADQPEDAARIALTHWQLGLKSAVLVVNPPPVEVALPREEVEESIQKALQNAARDGITGSATTPYLLGQMKELTHGKSLETNLALLRSNARLAARIAAFLYTDLNLGKA